MHAGGADAPATMAASRVAVPGLSARHLRCPLRPMARLVSLVEAWATTLVVLSLSFSVVLLCLPSRHTPSPKGKKRVVVLVVGDIGRSPRMQNHALAIARKGGIVDLVGYNESTLRPELLSNPSIIVHALSSPPRWLDTSTVMRFLLFAPFKAVYQLVQMFLLLCYGIDKEVGCVLVQNPPAVPTLLVTAFVTLLRRQKFVVDWHNFGYSILALKLKQHPLVLLSQVYEIAFARFANTNFTVTHSMQNVLRTSWGIRAPIHTLYDRPAAHFQPLDHVEKLAFLRSHPVTAPYAASIIGGTTKLLISQTSWTADEDFSLLLDALMSYDRFSTAHNFLASNKSDPTVSDEDAPHILAIITGRGPLRDGYVNQMDKLELQNVTVKSVWLEAADYPKMIACADFGVSLHTSSSGVDLPMKIVDLFGCGVPVVAMKFRAVAELVKNGENGLWFEDGKELGTIVERLAKRDSKELARLRQGAAREMEHRWDEEWDKVAAPVFGLSA